MADHELGFELLQLWTPGAIREYIKQVGDGFTALDRDISGRNVFDPATLKAWQIIRDNFRKFEADTGFFTALTLAPLRTAEAYAQQLIYWRNTFTTRSGRAATGAVVQIPSAQQEASINKLLWLGGLALGAYLAVNTFALLPRRRYGA